VGLMTGDEVFQDVAALLTAGRHHRQHPLHERAPPGSTHEENPRFYAIPIILIILC
jgi:hypothetical protein